MNLGAKVVTDQDLLSSKEMERAECYVDLLYPYGLKWFAGIGFRAGGGLWALTLQRTSRQGAFEEDDKRFLEPFSCRLTDAATLSMLVGRATLTNTVNALNIVPQAAIAIDRFGHVLEVNEQAAALFDQDIRVSLRRLFVSDVQARDSLDKLVDRFRPVSEHATSEIEPIVVRRRARPPVVVKALPLRGAARGPFIGACALFLLIELAPKKPQKERLLAAAYGLSPAEARLASRLATGAVLEDIAEEFGLSLSTVRNQLKAIFAKTDAHRQGELVAMLARL